MSDLNKFLDFLDASPSSFHAARELATLLENAGYRQQYRDSGWDCTPGGHYLIRDGALMAWWIPENASPESGFKILGSHLDSPGFLLKPDPDFTAQGYRQAAVEVYGGPIVPSWFDRDLAFAGRIILSDGSEHLVATGPIARIPHIAIHLDRSSTFEPDRQRDLQPIYALCSGGAALLEHIAHLIDRDITAADIVGHDLITVDTQPAAFIGSDHQFLASRRLDNLSSAYASVAAVLSVIASGDMGDDILVVAAFDHEEVGSHSASGAAGPLLEEVLTRTATSLGASRDEIHQMFARSSSISVDATHAVHPNHPEKHDPGHLPQLNAGPVIKANANQRYASTGKTAAMFRQACRSAGIPYQYFVSNNSVPCGSTIGPISATRLGIDTVDVGAALLSMHSSREIMGTDDELLLIRALEAYLVS
ncbi:M18 family aminopeptidase [Corynebacterium poyangense]|uniref:M18 family aminopeptidase n=1 Tax=Corynebacterium poyangense TaxID=2684405 RepID=A0A7H0SNU9_9CORY|nr:M18 family aminopeptidase [Corynebacterium poyangense]QNQ90224.1 M18 family aminopeptidase [Corynebacterium poyangense]